MTTQIKTLEELAHDVMKQCEDDGFAFQCFDENNQVRFCYWHFGKEVMKFCRYADTKTFVQVKGRCHYLCNAERKEIA